MTVSTLDHLTDTFTQLAHEFESEVHQQIIETAEKIVELMVASINSLASQIHQYQHAELVQRRAMYDHLEAMWHKAGQYYWQQEHVFLVVQQDIKEINRLLDLLANKVCQ